MSPAPATSRAAKQSSSRKTFTIVGATGSVGGVASELLAAGGHRVRSVSRRSGVSIDDTTALTDVFRGVDGAFVMVPFDQTAPSLHEREIDLAAKLWKPPQPRASLTKPARAATP
jgi:uncharacterized protein YbjT (DUF2867 family)